MTSVRARVALAGAFFLTVCPAAAQEGGLPQFTLGVQQRLEVADNLELSAAGGGTTATAVTGLSFGFVDATQIQSLSLSGNVDLRFSDGTLDEAHGLEDPRLAFSYAREGATSSLTVQSRYRRADVAFLRTAEDFPEGLPPDFEELEGTGTRTAYGAGGVLELGRDRPLGARLFADFDAIDYSDTSASLNDTRRGSTGGLLRFRLNPVVDATAGLRTSIFEEDDGQTRRQSTTADVGLAYDVSARTRLDAIAGYTVVETKEAFLPDAREEGLSGSVTFARETPTGVASAELTADTTQTGTRISLTAGRTVELPRARLAARLGATRNEAADPELIGTLSWQQDLPNGAFDASILSAVVTGSDDEDVLRTSLSAAYRHEINSLSSLGLNMSYTRSEDRAAPETLQTATLGANYRRGLTSDWGMTIGYQRRLREDSDAADPATSNSLYLTIGRTFEIRP